MDTPEVSGVCVFAPSTIVTVTVEEGTTQDEVHFHAGGQGFWIARLLGRLGVPTTLVTVVGGESGVVARALIEQEDIELRAVAATTANGAWIHDRRSGDRRSIAEDGGHALDRHVVDELFGAALASSMETGICVLAGPHRPTHISPAPYMRLSRDLRTNGVTVIADLSRDHLLAALDGGVDFCKTSDEDLMTTDGFDQDSPEELVRQLSSRGAANSVITRGSGTMIAFVEGELQEVSPPKLEEIDPRGAGDAFTALVAATRFWGLDWSEAIRWGAAAGALTVIRRGLATADRREIHQLLPRVQVSPLRG